MKEQSSKLRWVLFIITAVIFISAALFACSLAENFYYFSYPEQPYMMPLLGVLIFTATFFAIYNKKAVAILLSVLGILVSVPTFRDLYPNWGCDLSAGFYLKVISIINACIIFYTLTRNKSFWIAFIPILFGVGIVFTLGFFAHRYHKEYDHVAPTNLFAMATLIIAFAAALNIGRPQKVKTATEVGDQAEGYVDLLKHILLSIFTFGIWSLIWTYRTTKFLNNAPNAQWHDPTKKLLLCIFVPFYGIYWYYTQGQRLDSYAKQKLPNATERSTLYLILGIFIPIVASIMMQDCINSICTAQNAPAETPHTQDDSQVTADALIKYKELMDMGIITQEEFDAKKKQLLGL